MFEFKDYQNAVNEALVTFGKKAYPKFGQVVILAGGAGSGKGFVTEKMLGIEGKVLDVDELKKLVIKSKELSAAIKDETGYDIKTMDLRKPDNVSLMHKLIGTIYGIAKKNEMALLKSVAAVSPDRKPNILFDVTLKDTAKLKKISENMIELGYAKENIHIVWVVNDVKVAIKQNATRDRVVPHDILISTHVGASRTMNQLLNSGDAIKQYMDGDIWLVFNKKDVDVTNKRIVKNGKTYEISFPSKILKIKEQGKVSQTFKQIDKTLYDKIKQYIPQIVSKEI